MTSGSDLINQNWKQAECEFYAGGTQVAASVAIGSLITQQYWATIGAAAAGLAFEYAAGLAGCNNNPDPPNVDGDDVGIDGCREVDVAGTLYSGVDDQSMGGPMGNGILKIVGHRPNPATGKYEDGVTWDLIDYNGAPRVYNANYARGRLAYIRPGAGGTCLDSTTPEPPLPPDAIGKPTEVEDGDCIWTFTPKDSYIDASGAVRVYYVIEANNDACGGPFAYWSGPSNPTPVNPNPPDCPEGEDCDPIPPEPLPCCDDIKQLLEQIKDCACKDPKPELRGDWRSVHFESDAPSPGGTRPLRKYFRYRSESGSTVAQLGAHWKDFTWQAGSVIVVHKGAWWGQAKVWAASIDEGKRVIRHAAAEAGIDPDQVGEWVVTGSSDPRYGMSGTMRPVLYDGLTWATARTGPSGPPMIESDS